MWHISNEFGGECYCKSCVANFRKYLAKRYDNDIEKLNHAWWTTFWSHRFTDFDQIDPPYETGESCVLGLTLDWKYVNDRYGDEESDRLIATVAGIISDEAKPDYVIGRVDGDVFNVVIPMPADNESEEYIDRVRQRMDSFEDEHIAPSVAIGLSYKNNVEKTMEDALSDAEYAMFENKIEVKNAPGYLDRLHKE